MSSPQDYFDSQRELAEAPQNQFMPCLCIWSVKAYKPETGEIVYEELNKNVVTLLGKQTVLSLLFGLTLGSSLMALAAGSGSTSATSADVRLVTELIGNAARLPIGSLSSTSASFVPLSNSDIVHDPQTIGGINYDYRLACRGIYPLSDGNNGSNFREFALANTAIKPATSTTQSGWIYNRFVAAGNIPKDGTIQIDVDTYVYF